MVVRTLALAIGLMLALATSQLPEFAQQYRQRLGGAVDELGRLVTQLRSDAAAAGLDLAGLVARLKANPDEPARRQGDTIAATLRRYDALSAQYRDLTRQGAVGRTVTLVTGADPAIARRTLDDYSPAIPTTPTGLVMALIGFLIGLGGVHGTSAAIKRAGSRRAVRLRPAAAARPKAGPRPDGRWPSGQ